MISDATSPGRRRYSSSSTPRHPGQTCQVHRPELERVEERRKRVRKIRQVEDLRRIGGPAGPWFVPGDDRELVGKTSQLVVPRCGCPRPHRGRGRGRPLTDPLVGDPEPACFDKLHPRKLLGVEKVGKSDVTLRPTSPRAPCPAGHTVPMVEQAPEPSGWTATISEGRGTMKEVPRVAGDRDRDGQGRAQQARPRDALGGGTRRPMARQASSPSPKCRVRQKTRWPTPAVCWTRAAPSLRTKPSRSGGSRPARGTRAVARPGPAVRGPDPPGTRQRRGGRKAR